MESAAVEAKTEETGKKINDICSMSWLKRNSQSSVEFKDGMDVKEITPKTQNMEDFVAGTKPVKKKKNRKSKSKAASSADRSKDVNSRNSDTETEHSRLHGKREPKLSPMASITVTSSTTVWNAKTNAAVALFPEAQQQPIHILDEELLLNAALKESIFTARLEEFRTDDENKVNWADDLEDSECYSAHNCLHEISDDKDKGMEKVERKSEDDNNNSNNNSTNSKEQDPKEIDKNRRDGSFAERNLFMGKGTRMKEEYGHDSNRGPFNRRPSNLMSEKSEPQHFQKNDPYDYRNRTHRDYFDNRSSFDKRSNDDKREYRNRNFQTFNHRGRFENHQHRFDNQNHCHRHDNHPQRYDNPYQRNDNKHQQYNTQHYRYDNQHQRYDNHQRRFDNNRIGNNPRRDFPNRDQNPDFTFHKQEFKDSDSHKFQDNKEHSAHDSCEKDTLETQQPPEKEKEVEIKIPETKPEVKPDETPETKPEVKPDETPDLKPDQENIKEVSNTSTPIAEDASSLCFMQESFKDKSCENAVENDDTGSDSVSEHSEYQETQAVLTNPFMGRPIPFQIHPPAMMCQTPEGVPIHNGLFPAQSISTHNKVPGTMAYSVITNPFIAPVPNRQFQHQQIHEIPSETGCTSVPMQNVDMRFYNQLPAVPTHPFMPILPMGIQSCGQIPQMPIGNFAGMNFVHQHPVNCQQCPQHMCQAPQIPLQNLSCQSPAYPQFATVMTPMGPALMQITPVNQDRIVPQSEQISQQEKHSRPNKVKTTPATAIEKSANNLVNLCENLPPRRGNYTSNCPPGFEKDASTENQNANQRKIICDKRDTLPSFRNISKDYVEEKSRKSSKKTEEFTDEKLASICNDIFSKKEDLKIPVTWSETVKFSQDSYCQDLLKSYMNTEENPPKSENNVLAPRPGFRAGLGRGKKVAGRTD